MTIGMHSVPILTDFLSWLRDAENNLNNIICFYGEDTYYLHLSLSEQVLNFVPCSCLLQV